MPLSFLFDTPWHSQTSSQSSSRSHPALATLGFHPQYWERVTSSVAWGHFLPSFWLHQWFQTFYHSLPFPGCERFSLSQVKVDIIIFSRNFLHFFKIFSFLSGFFFFASTDETFFVNPALGTMDITSPKDFPSCSLHAESNSLSITDPMFFTSFFVGLKIFISWKLFGLTFYFCGCLPSAHHTTCAFFEEATLYWCC